MSWIAPKDSAVQAVSAVIESVRYQDRRAGRQGGEQRRQAILDAAMRLIVHDGAWAVRYRAAVAKAQMPSSATTYYFKDIDDLITDIFTPPVERSAEALSAFWSSAEGNPQGTATVLTDDPGIHGPLVERIVELAVQCVQVRLTERRKHLPAEQAFRREALLDPRLREPVDAHRWILPLGAVHFFQMLGPGQPKQDTKVSTSVILQMEYQGLVDGVE